MTRDRPLRVGVVVPRGNTVHAREFARLQHPSLQYQFEDFTYPEFTANVCADAVERLIAPMRALKAWGAAVVLFGCTTVSMLCRGGDLERRMEDVVQAPVITAASASSAALAALGVKTVSVATPYGERNNRIIADFLTESGFDVVAMAGLDLDRSAAEWLAAQPTLTGERALELARATDRAEADGLYLPCTGMLSLDAIAGYELEFAKPAVSSVQAGYWAALRAAGFDGRRGDAGRLIATWDA